MGIRDPSPAYKSKAKNITLLSPQTTPRYQDQPPHRSIMTPAKPSTPRYCPSRKGRKMTRKSSPQDSRAHSCPRKSLSLWYLLQVLAQEVQLGLTVH